MGGEETEARATTAERGARATRRVLDEHRGGIASAALLAGGALTVLVAVALVPGVGPHTRPFAVGVLVTLAVVTTVVGLGNRHGRRETWPPPRLSFAVAVLALAAAAVLVTAGLVVDLRGGLVDPDVPVLLLGLLAATAGAIRQWLLTASRRSPRAAAPKAKGHRSVPALAGLLGALVVVLACWAGGAVVAGLPERSTTAAGYVPLPPPAPALPTEVAWTVEVPGERVVPGRGSGGPVVALAAAGSGVAYGSDSSVVALDGATGGERWRYELTGASLAQVQATPGGELVVATYASTSRDAEHPVRRVTLDGTTGDVRHVERGLEPPPSGYGAPPLDLTRSHVVSREDGVVDVRALDGSGQWRRPTPAGCETYDAGATAAAVVVLDLCAGAPRRLEARAVALETATGAELWRFERTITVIGDFDDGAQVTGSTDGSAVRVEVSGGSVSPLVDVVLAADDGRVVSDDGQLEDFFVVDFSAADGSWGWPGTELSPRSYERRNLTEGEEVVGRTCGRGEASRGGRLLVACLGGDGDDSITSLQLQPWAGGPAQEVVVDPPLLATTIVDRRSPVVAALPGLVVLTTLGDGRLIGLR